MPRIGLDGELYFITAPVRFQPLGNGTSITTTRRRRILDAMWSKDGFEVKA